eukprot:1849680-Pleurochrysis_carterae.AAC.2
MKYQFSFLRGQNKPSYLQKAGLEAEPLIHMGMHASFCALVGAWVRGACLGLLPETLCALWCLCALSNLARTSACILSVVACYCVLVFASYVEFSFYFGVICTRHWRDKDQKQNSFHLQKHVGLQKAIAGISVSLCCIPDRKHQACLQYNCSDTKHMSGRMPND